MNRPSYCCPHWREADTCNGPDDSWHTEEYCLASRKPCACCGDKGDCSHPEELAAEAEAKLEKDR